MKATKQYVPVVLFIMLHKMVLTFESVQMKATKQYAPVVLFITLYIEFTSWLVSAYDFYSRAVENHKRTSESYMN